jgi:hypothetical protein
MCTIYYVLIRGEPIVAIVLARQHRRPGKWIARLLMASEAG